MRRECCSKLSPSALIIEASHCCWAPNLGLSMRRGSCSKLSPSALIREPLHCCLEAMLGPSISSDACSRSSLTRGRPWVPLAARVDIIVLPDWRIQASSESSSRELFLTPSGRELLEERKGKRSDWKLLSGCYWSERKLRNHVTSGKRRVVTDVTRFGWCLGWRFCYIRQGRRFEGPKNKNNIKKPTERCSVKRGTGWEVDRAFSSRWRGVMTLFLWWYKT